MVTGRRGGRDCRWLWSMRLGQPAGRRREQVIGAASVRFSGVGAPRGSGVARSPQSFPHV